MKKYSKYIILLSYLFTLSCQKTSSSDADPADKIADVPLRAVSVKLQNVQIPSGLDASGKVIYSRLGPDDLTNSAYPQPIKIQTRARMDEALMDGEEKSARGSRIFPMGPGFLWSVDPVTPVRIILKTSSGASQVIKGEPIETISNNSTVNLLAVSLWRFDQIFPPSFREQYELEISSLEGFPTPFNYKYTFTIHMLDNLSIYTKIIEQDPKTKLKLARDVVDYKFGKVVPSEDVCDRCTIEILEPKGIATIKRFVELPALPADTNHRISYPARFSGLLARIDSKSFNIEIRNNNTEGVSLYAVIPASFSTVDRWCKNIPGSSMICLMQLGAQNVGTYFGYLNNVPFDVSSKQLGGISGVAYMSLNMQAKVRLKRNGALVEEKNIIIESGQISPVDDPSLPGWSADEFNKALNTGAPEFPLPTE
jgi:hypothetical protein